MRKNNKFILNLTCIFMFLGILVVVFIGQKMNSDDQTLSANIENNQKAGETLNKNANDTQTSDENTKDQNEKNIENNRFDGLKLTSDDIGIPVLCYHDVTPTNPGNNELLLSPDKFKEQMKYLKDNNYFPITLDEFFEFYKNNKEIPEKSVLITFDDGYVGNYTYAYPILKDFGFRATVFVISEFMDTSLYMTKAQIKEINSNGFNVQSHTAKHEDLSTLSEEKQIDTMKKSKEALEKVIDQSVDYIAYPFGKSNPQTRVACTKANYKLGFNLAGPLADRGDNSYNIDRIYIGNSDTLDSFSKKLLREK